MMRDLRYLGGRSGGGVPSGEDFLLLGGNGLIEEIRQKVDLIQ